MFNIAFNGIITATRGDSFSFPLQIDFGNTCNTTSATLGPNDKLYVAVMEPNQPFEDALIKKVYTSADIVKGIVNIKFKPSDTECVLPGKYYYQIKLQRFNQESNDPTDYDVDTIIDKTLFFILE